MMLIGILPSRPTNFYIKRKLFVIAVLLLIGCAPTAEKQETMTEDEKVLTKGMEILASSELTDKTAATAALEQACNMGNNYGCHKIGIAFNNGLYGKKKDYVEAKKWYELAGNRGYVPSQLNIANLYAHRLLPFDDKTGYTWLARAGEGLRVCAPGSIEGKPNTPDVERRRLCQLANTQLKKLYGIYRKRMNADDMHEIEQSITGKNFR